MSGLYPLSILPAPIGFSGDEPAQALRATVTNAPASAACNAVDRTQQSVATPASSRCGYGPVLLRIPSHLLKVVLVTTLSAVIRSCSAVTISSMQFDSGTLANADSL